MRERFELAVKIVGLVLACGGILLTVAALFRLIVGPSWSSYLSWVEAAYPQSIPEQLRPALAQLDDLMSAGWRSILADMAVQGLVPIALGLYLMCSGRLAVRWAYPSHGTASGGAPSGDLGRGKTPGAAAPGPSDSMSEGDDRRYAPPGMYEG